MGEKKSGKGNLLILSEDEDDDDAQTNTVLPDNYSQPDEDMSMYGKLVKKDSDDDNLSSNVADDVQTAEKIPPNPPDNSRQSDELTSLTFGIDVKDDRKDEKPDPVHNIFAPKRSMRSMDSNSDSITDQLNISSIMASRLAPKECRGDVGTFSAIDGKLRKRSNSKEKEKVGDEQFPIVKVEETSNDNKNKLREGTDYDEADKIDASQFAIVKEQSTDNKDTLIEGSGSNEKESIDDLQPDTDLATLSVKEKLSSEIGSKSERKSTLEHNPSFKASRENEERSTIGIPAISSAHDTDEIGSKIARKLTLGHNPSFKAAREKAGRLSIGIQTSSSEHGVKANTVPGVTNTNIKPTQISNKTEKDNTMVVAAIDFGTTFSAVAFSFTQAPEAIYTKTWNGNVKVPTVILLDPDKKVHSFGDEAKRVFHEKYDVQDTYKKWFYFDCFKMNIFVVNQYLDKDIKLKDFSGKEMAAKDVFEKAISYMKGEMLTLLTENRRGITTNPTTDIHWVLTVPAIWPDLSKTFMREAAEKAGIPRDFLTLALEPEAASLYCRRNLGVELRGKTYIILDLGGGTADLVCHEGQHDDSIKECHMASGGNFGGKMVNDKFMECLTNHYGAEIVKKFRRTKEYLDFIEEFEIKKNHFDGTGEFVYMTLPQTLNDIYQRAIGEPVEITSQQSIRQGKLFCKRGKIGIPMGIMQAMFDEPLKHIIETTRGIIEHVQNVNHIILVGGFSNSKYITQCIQHNFPEEGFVLTIDNPEVSVVKGAVIFGHENKSITTRISKYTYGIGRLMKFKPGDREDYKIKANGTFWCDNCFNKHIGIGEEMHCDDVVKAHDYFPPDKDTKNFIIEVIASKNSDPKYTTDEGCYSIGILPLEMDVWSKVEVKLVSKETELEIQAYHVNSGKLTTGKVDFWS